MKVGIHADPAVAEFQAFEAKYSKVYSSEQERESRFLIFKDNKARAEQLNKVQTTAQFGVTPFMDQTPEEFQSRLMNPKIPTTPKGAKVADLFYAPQQLPTSFDWSMKGALTPVKNQEQCGSCWAFSATEEIESVAFLSGSYPLDVLSPQQIVDCDTTCYGCDGGWPYDAYAYIVSTGGIESESDYPYAGVDENCMFNSADVEVQITGWEYVTQNENETQMQYYLYNYAPLSICVDADVWQYYTGGVIGANCGDSIDHCVQLTGYTTFDNINSWIVRNSWGTDWGYAGYLYLQMGQDTCAMAQVVTVPTI